jgi:hypothetical protein
MFVLAEHYVNGFPGLLPDPQKALYWFTRLVNSVPIYVSGSKLVSELYLATSTPSQIVRSNISAKYPSLLDQELELPAEYIKGTVSPPASLLDSFSSPIAASTYSHLYASRKDKTRMLLSCFAIARLYRLKKGLFAFDSPSFFACFFALSSFLLFFDFQLRLPKE